AQQGVFVPWLEGKRDPRPPGPGHPGRGRPRPVRTGAGGPPKAVEDVPGPDRAASLRTRSDRSTPGPLLGDGRGPLPGARTGSATSGVQPGTQQGRGAGGEIGRAPGRAQWTSQSYTG